MIGDLFCWVMEKLFIPLVTAAVALAMLAGLGAGLFFGSKWVLGLRHDVHGQDYARIVARAYTPNTQQTNTVPVVAGKSVGVGVVTTGYPEAFTTMLLLRGKVYSFDDRTLWALGAVGDSVVVHYKTNPQWPTQIESVDFQAHQVTE